MRQGLSKQPRLASNSQSYCFGLSSAGVTGVLYHTWVMEVSTALNLAYAWFYFS